MTKFMVQRIGAETLVKVMLAEKLKYGFLSGIVGILQRSACFTLIR